MLENNHKSILLHYGGILALLLVIYFAFGPMFMKLEDAYIAHLHGPQTVATAKAPQATSNLGKAVSTAVDAAKSAALSAAIANEAVQLSAAQSTIARAVGLSNSKFGAGLVSGLTTAAPKREVVTVATGVKSKLSPPPPALTDDQIQKSLKSVLETTTLKTTVDTNVKVSWEDKPFSPIFAAYAADGGSGVGVTIRRTPFLNLDGLLLKRTVGSVDSFEAGVGVDHIIKGTAGSIGAALLVNPKSHTVSPTVFAGIRF